MHARNGSTHEVFEEEYTRAAELWPNELLDRVTNALVIPTWLPGEDRFWYRHETGSGHHFVVVDAATGAQEPAFDHREVAELLGADRDSLPIESFAYEGEDLVLTMTDRPGITRIGQDGTVDTVQAPDSNAFRGPDGRETFVRGHNLWIRDGRGFERQLTTDGVEHFGWAEAPDNDYDQVGRIGRTRAGLPQAMQGVFWSSDGRHLFVPRVDEREVREYPYIENVPADGSLFPEVHWVRRKMFGDSETTRWLWHVVDVRTGEQVRVDALPGDLQIQPWHCWWTSRDTILALASNDAQDAAALVEVRASDGSVRVVHMERDRMFRFNNSWFHDDNVAYVAERDEFVWFTQASGWPHLWIIDVPTGAVRQLTDGEWVVQDLIRVTDDHVFFTAGGRAAGVNPYLRSLHRVDLDGSEANANLVCVTPEAADHAFPVPRSGGVWREWGPRPEHLHSCVSPSGRYVVDNISRVDLPTVTVLRDASGAIISEIARAGTDRLDEIGWQQPEPFCTKGADGETDIWGVIIKPRLFDERDSWPVLERIYGGHQVLAQPRSFLEGINGAFMFGLHAFADMGFVVVVMDGPGTPLRSRAFRDMTWNQDDRFGVVHHRAALENLATSRPWMNLENVGVSGHSSGGYATLMCLLREPDFYKVGFSSSPALGADGFQAYVIEAHFGRPDYGSGREVRLHDGERAPSHEVWHPETLVERLRGRLMLAYGDVDEECEPPLLYQFIRRLIDAGKDFDQMVMAGESHYYTTQPYYQKRLWDYFIRHVQGREPLRHHTLAVDVGQRLWNTCAGRS